MSPKTDALEMILARIDSLDRKLEAFMGQNQQTHDMVMIDLTRIKADTERGQADISRAKDDIEKCFSKVRKLERQIVYFTGAGAVVVFLAIKLIEKYWK